MSLNSRSYGIEFVVFEKCSNVVRLSDCTQILLSMTAGHTYQAKKPIIHMQTPFRKIPCDCVTHNAFFSNSNRRRRRLTASSSNSSSAFSMSSRLRFNVDRVFALDGVAVILAKIPALSSTSSRSTTCIASVCVHKCFMERNGVSLELVAAVELRSHPRLNPLQGWHYLE